MKTLVAEDNTTFRLILGALLKKLNAEVTAVENGHDAWKAFQNEYFPVLITDWQMPQMDGIELTRLVRARPHSAYTYVIMLTAKGDRSSFLEAMKAGVDDFIPKPPDEEQLAARLLVAERIVGMQDHLHRLESLMSVCSYCRNVRQENNEWVQMEAYVSKNLGVDSTHGICPNCYQTKVKPELESLGIECD